MPICHTFITFALQTNNASMKNNKIFLYALAIGLTGLVFALGVQKNSESNIKPILEDALQESIVTS